MSGYAIANPTYGVRLRLTRCRSKQGQPLMHTTRSDPLLLDSALLHRGYLLPKMELINLKDRRFLASTTFFGIQ